MAEAERIVGSIGIRVVPDFSTFNEQLKSGLAGSAGQSFAPGMASAQSRFTQSERKLNPMSPVGGGGADPQVDAMAARVSAAAAAGNWAEHRTAMDALLAYTPGAGGGGGGASASLFSNMAFFGGGTTGLPRSDRAFMDMNAVSASSQRGDVRGSAMKLSGAGEAEVSAVIQRETAAHQKYLDAINRAAASMEKVAAETARQESVVVTSLANRLHQGVQTSIGAGLDPGQVINSAIGSAAARQRRNNIWSATQITGAPGQWGMSNDLLDEGAAMEGRMSAGGLTSSEDIAGFGMSKGMKRFVTGMPNPRVMIMQAMFGAWEGMAAQNAINRGDLSAAGATSPTGQLEAKLQQQQMAWGGFFSSLAGIGLDVFGKGPVSLQQQFGPTLALMKSQDLLRTSNISAQFSASGSAAAMGGDDLGVRINKANEAMALARNEIEPQLHHLRSQLGQSTTSPVTAMGMQLRTGFFGFGGQDAITTTRNLEGPERAAAINTVSTLQNQLAIALTAGNTQIAMDTREANLAASRINIANNATTAMLAGNPFGAAIAGVDAQYVKSGGMINGIGPNDPRYAGLMRASSLAVQQVGREHDFSMAAVANMTLSAKLGQTGFPLEAAQRQIDAAFKIFTDSSGTRFINGMAPGASGYAEAQAAYTQAGSSAATDYERGRGLFNAEVQASNLATRGEPFAARRSKAFDTFYSMTQGLDQSSPQFGDQLSREKADLASIDKEQKIVGAALNLQFSTEEAVDRRRLARDPIGASVVGFGGSVMARADAILAQFGEVEGASYAVKSLKAGKLGVQALAQEYFDSFRGTAVDLRLMDVTNKRDQSDPAKILEEIKDVLKTLDGKIADILPTP